MFNCCNIYFSFTVILCRKGNVQLLHEDLILKGTTHLKHQSSTVLGIGKVIYSVGLVKSQQVLFIYYTYFCDTLCRMKDEALKFGQAIRFRGPGL